MTIRQDHIFYDVIGEHCSPYLSSIAKSGKWNHERPRNVSCSPQALAVYTEAVLTRRCVLCLVFSGTYALVITGRQALGTYKGHPIYRVTSLKVLPCNNNLHKATPEEVSCFSYSSNCFANGHRCSHTIFSYVVISLYIINAEKG